MKPKHILAVVFLAAAGAAAAGPATNRAVRAGPMDDFQLTPEQQARSAQIMKERRAGIRAALQASSAARRELFARTYASAYDEAAVREAARRSAACEETLALERARLMRDVRAILTPAQQAKLDGAREQMLQSFDARARREGTLLDAWIEEHDAP